MPRANLTLTIPEHIWIGEISRTHPAATVRILAALAGDDAGVGLAEITSENLPSILDDIAASESVVELDILRQQSDEALIQFETTTPLLLFPIQDSGVPLEMPFTIEEGKPSGKSPHRSDGSRSSVRSSNSSGSRSPSTRSTATSSRHSSSPTRSSNSSARPSKRATTIRRDAAR